MRHDDQLQLLSSAFVKLFPGTLTCLVLSYSMNKKVPYTALPIYEFHYIGTRKHIPVNVKY